MDPPDKDLTCSHGYFIRKMRTIQSVQSEIPQQVFATIKLSKQDSESMYLTLVLEFTKSTYLQLIGQECTLTTSAHMRHLTV